MAMVGTAAGETAVPAAAAWPGAANAKKKNTARTTAFPQQRMICGSPDLVGRANLNKSPGRERDRLCRNLRYCWDLCHKGLRDNGAGGSYPASWGSAIYHPARKLGA